MSTNFGPVDLTHLPFPVHMYIDYIRVYQPKGQRNIGCDPPDFPTATYINTYAPALSLRDLATDPETMNIGTWKLIPTLTSPLGRGYQKRVVSTSRTRGIASSDNVDTLSLSYLATYDAALKPSHRPPWLRLSNHLVSGP
jgi:hypothetical protein